MNIDELAMLTELASGIAFALDSGLLFAARDIFETRFLARLRKGDSK